MSWLRIEGKMPGHAKVAPLSDSAFRLHVTAMAWCVEHETDGRVPKSIVFRLTGAPRQGKKLDAVLAELEKSKLWIPGDEWTIHDFLDWNISAAEAREIAKARAEAGRAGGRASGKQRRSKREASASNLGKQNASKPEANANESATDLKPESESDLPEKVIPKDPSGGVVVHPPEFSSSRKFEESFGPGPAGRPDVREVYEAWKQACGYRNAKFRGAFDLDATRLAEAIDAHGLAACLLVARHSNQDPKVNGKADDHGQRHDTIRYIFENSESFNRILRLANDREGKSKRLRPASELVAEAKRL